MTGASLAGFSKGGDALSRETLTGFVTSSKTRRNDLLFTAP